MILTQLNIEAHLSPEEVEFLDAERKRMDVEEPISQPWSRESVLEAWLQIAIDCRRVGMRQDMHVSELISACRQLLDAPHYEHFAVRLNDQELAGLEAIKKAVARC